MCLLISFEHTKHDDLLYLMLRIGDIGRRAFSYIHTIRTIVTMSSLQHCQVHANNVQFVCLTTMQPAMYIGNKLSRSVISYYLTRVQVKKSCKHFDVRFREPINNL